MAETSVLRYEVVDFKGHVPWAKLDDGSYAVDPLYVKKFLKMFK